MNAQTGSAGSSLIDKPQSQLSPSLAPASGRPRSAYLRDLALRREALAIRQQTGYGLIVGWVATLVFGFLYFCVPSRFDALWALLIAVGLLVLLFLLGYVVPRFSAVYEEIQGNLPLMSRLLLEVGKFLDANGFAAVVVALGGLALAIRLAMTPAARR